MKVLSKIKAFKACIVPGLKEVCYPVGLVVIILLLATSPFTSMYILYGQRQNGFVVYRYPGFTEIKSSRHEYTIIGRNDCKPEYRHVTVASSKLAFSVHQPLSQEDIDDWNKALGTN